MLFFLTRALLFSQDEDFFKKQFDFAHNTRQYYEGFSHSVGNNDFSYHSLRNNINDALLTRCTTGEMAIEWETATIPPDHKGKTVSFVWMAALDLTGKSDRFDVSVNGIKQFVITSSQQSDWELEGNEGAKLSFTTFTKDQHGDAHGYMSLTGPTKWFDTGKPARIKIVGENKGENTWVIVYKASDVTHYLQNAALYEGWMNIHCNQQNNAFSFSIEAPFYLTGKAIEYHFGDRSGKAVLKEHDDLSMASFIVKEPTNLHLVIQDDKNKLVDIEDITIPASTQTIQSQTILLNEVRIDQDRILIKSRRIYSPNTVKSLRLLEESNLGEGTIYLMNSSHQDIAWMDSPEKCVIERDTMLLTPLLEDAQAKTDYRFDIEDALMIKEYINRHPDKEAAIKKMLLDGKISCGASYTQPYEEMYSGEALARQFYFGRKWLNDRFGYDANTYWNVDVPGRTPQMPQIMKKANVDYLMISRFEKGIFKWYSPDSSSVLTYSSGHYADAFAAMNKSFYESAEYIASSSMDWSNYFTGTGQDVAIPLLSDWDMSPPKDYSQLINSWENMDQLELEPGKEIKAKLPEIKLSTAPDFLMKFEKSASNLPSVKGERPAVWIYIHGPGHQKAIKASREADILLTVAEKFATMDALARNSFTNYPQKRLTRAWEAKIYPDHGWGGKEGQITDDLFKRKYEFARNEAKQIIENTTSSLAGQIQTKDESGVPIVVFNSLNWERNDVVSCKVNFDAGAVNSFKLLDSKQQVIPHQYTAMEQYPDGSIKSADICFVAENVPSLGYTCFYIIAENNTTEEYPTTESESFENDFYKIEFAADGIRSIFDKELGIELFDTKKFMVGEVFTMQSEGHGAGEFDNVQPPGMKDFDKTSNYQSTWERIASGPVYSSFKIRQPIKNAVVEQTITVFNSIKKIDFDVALLNWEGILYREYRMAFPLNMEEGRVAYEVPYGISEVGKDEIDGAAGERYQTPAADIHPRGIENWIGASNEQFGLTLSSSVVAADYLDPTEPDSKAILLQPILLASRRSCHPEGNAYLQTGDHHFNFSLHAHQPGWEHGFRFGKQANEKLHTVVKPDQFKEASLPEMKSFIKLNTDNIVVSAVKKSEDDESVIIRLYDILGQQSNFNMELDFTAEKVFRTSLIEKDITEYQHDGKSIPIELGKYSIETFKLIPVE